MSSRTYTVGVPLIVTVSDTGVVTYEVDASEISREMSEQFEDGNDDGIHENEMLLDGAVVDGHTFAAVTLTETVRVKCPVKYGCPVECYSLEEMGAHIDDASATHA